MLSPLSHVSFLGTLLNGTFLCFIEYSWSKAHFVWSNKNETGFSWIQLEDSEQNQF